MKQISIPTTETEMLSALAYTRHLMDMNCIDSWYGMFKVNKKLNTSHELKISTTDFDYEFPLAMVGRRPVFRGDKLFFDGTKEITALGWNPNGYIIECTSEYPVDRLFWKRKFELATISLPKPTGDYRHCSSLMIQSNELGADHVRLYYKTPEERDHAMNVLRALANSLKE